VSGLTHDQISELLGAYALHAVDPDEAIAVELHLEECPRCRDEVNGHREVAALLGNTGGAAPDGVWDRIAGSLEESPPPMRLSLPDSDDATVVPLASRRRPAASRFIVAAVGAAAAVVIAVLGVQVVSLQDRYDDLQAALEDDAVLSAANLALVDPAATRTDLAAPDGGLTASAVLLPNGTGYLMVHDLPELGEDRTYQLWGQTESGLISLGILGAAPNDVVPFQASDSIDLLAITEEAAGGVVQSANPAVVAGEIA
jgi:anti-sigma factor RsiW